MQTPDNYSQNITYTQLETPEQQFFTHYTTEHTHTPRHELNTIQNISKFQALTAQPRHAIQDMQYS